MTDTMMPMIDDNPFAYRSTSELPDEEGEALLRELNALWGLIDFDENGKKRRRNSYERQYAATALQKAVLDAADRFSAHENTAWLCHNHCEHIETYDPLRMPREMRNEIHDLRWKVELLEDEMKSYRKLLRDIVVRLPPEKTK